MVVLGKLRFPFLFFPLPSNRRRHYFYLVSLAISLFKTRTRLKFHAVRTNCPRIEEKVTTIFAPRIELFDNNRFVTRFRSKKYSRTLKSSNLGDRTEVAEYHPWSLKWKQPPPPFVLDASSTPFQVVASLLSSSLERDPVEALEARLVSQSLSLSPPFEEPLPPLLSVPSPDSVGSRPPSSLLLPSACAPSAGTRLSTPPSHPSRAIMKDINYNFISNYR